MDYVTCGGAGPALYLTVCIIVIRTLYIHLHIHDNYLGTFDDLLGQKIHDIHMDVTCIGK